MTTEINLAVGVALGPTSGVGTLTIAPVTAPSSPPTDQFAIYVYTPYNKLKVRSGGGTVTNAAVQ